MPFQGIGSTEDENDDDDEVADILLQLLPPPPPSLVVVIVPILRASFVSCKTHYCRCIFPPPPS